MTELAVIPLSVIPLAAAHEAEWRPLFRAYRAFYKWPEDERVIDRVWAWLNDPAHVLEGLVAVQEGRLVGLAHFRGEPSPTRGMEVGFLNDLFVDPQARGAKAGEALLEELRRIAAARGWPLVRWITADDNYRARTLYDRVAKKTAWNLYEMSAG